MPSKLYGNFVLKALNKEVDFDTDTIKVALLTSSYTPDQDAHDYFNDVSSAEVTGTGYTAGGATLASGYFQGSNQGSSTIDISKAALLKFQLERNTFTSAMFELTLVCSASSNGDQIHASLDWEEVVR